LYCIFFLLTPTLFAQEKIDTAEIKNELHSIYDRDQKTRKSSDSSAFASYIDSCNLVQVESIIKKYGWPGKSFVGDKGNQAVFLVIQHADLATQEKYFPLLKASVEKGESDATEMAMMHDRILMRKGEKQIYGSQVVLNKSGGQEFYPIADEKNVNVKRAQVGMEPIEEYAKYFGIDYKPPQH